MLLQDKNAIIYGAGGNIGGAVARTFAREGAQVFLAGRTAATPISSFEFIGQSSGPGQRAALNAAG